MSSLGLVGDFYNEPYEVDARRAAVRSRVPVRLRARPHPAPDDPHAYLVACCGRLIRVLRSTWSETLLKSYRALEHAIRYVFGIQNRYLL